MKNDNVWLRIALDDLMEELNEDKMMMQADDQAEVYGFQSLVDAGLVDWRDVPDSDYNRGWDELPEYGEDYLD